MVFGVLTTVNLLLSYPVYIYMKTIYNYTS